MIFTHPKTYVPQVDTLQENFARGQVGRQAGVCLVRSDAGDHRGGKQRRGGRIGRGWPMGWEAGGEGRISQSQLDTKTGGEEFKL